MLKRLSGTSVTAERPSTNMFQKDSGDTASWGNRKEKPMIAMSSILIIGYKDLVLYRDARTTYYGLLHRSTGHSMLLARHHSSPPAPIEYIFLPYGLLLLLCHMIISLLLPERTLLHRMYLATYLSKSSIFYNKKAGFKTGSSMYSICATAYSTE